MTTRRRSNKWHVANDTTASSMAVFSPELAPSGLKKWRQL